MAVRQSLSRAANRARDLLFIPGTISLWQQRLKGNVMALVYHRVGDPGRYDFLQRGGTPVIQPKVLLTELQWLRDNGARFLTCADIRNGIFPEEHEFGVIITFDDGFRDNYTTGLEVLNNVGIKSVFFQCSAMIDGQELIPEHTLYWFADQPESAKELLELARADRWPGAEEATAGRLHKSIGRWLREVPVAILKQSIAVLRERFPTAELATALYPRARDIRRAFEEGHEIASHGNEHLHRATLDTVGFEHELSLSLLRIETVTGIKPAAFSYPFNGYQPADHEICKRYFQQTLTVDQQLIRRDTDPMSMGRFSWPGPARNSLRLRRWLLTGTI